MNKRRPLTTDEVAESLRLKAMYEARKAALRASGKSLTQAEVAEACGWSGQSAFSQYATGKVPLNLEALLKLAKVLEFFPEQVSTRLLKMVAITPPANEVDNREKAQQARTLALLASPRSQSALTKIAEAADSGRLTEDDVLLLEKIAERIAAKPAADPNGPNERIARKIRDAAKDPERG